MLCCWSIIDSIFIPSVEYETREHIWFWHVYYIISYYIMTQQPMNTLYTKTSCLRQLKIYEPIID